MEPRSRRLALALVVAAGCGAPSGIAIAPAWDAPGTPISRDAFGHNTVWARDGLGLWNAAAGAPDADVLADARALAPGLLRFPGGTRAMRYRFDQAIGATRTAQCDTFAGTLDATTYGPREFLGVAAALDADVTWVAPWVDGSPQQTAALAAWLRGDGATSVTLGTDGNGVDWGNSADWAAKRGGAPFDRVELLEVGNEPYLGLPAGPSTSCGRASQFVQDERWSGGTRIPTTAADYAAQLAATAALVRQVAPGLQLGAPATSQYDGSSDAMTAVGDVDANAGGDAWNARLLSDARDAFDFFVLHPYDFTVDDEARIHLADRVRKTVHDLRAAAPDKGVAVTEFGFLFGGGTLLNAIVTADMTRLAIEEQLVASVRHILVEDSATGPFADSAAILGPTHDKRPGYFAARLVSQLQPIYVPTRDDTLVPDGTLVALATRDAATSRLAVLVIDRRTDDGPARDLRLSLPSGHWALSTATLTGDTLAATTVDVANADLGRASGSARISVPAHAVMLVLGQPG